MFASLFAFCVVFIIALICFLFLVVCSLGGGRGGIRGAGEVGRGGGLWHSIMAVVSTLGLSFIAISCCSDTLLYAYVFACMK